jgi:hypothetical protein
MSTEYAATETRLPVSRPTLRKVRRAKEDAGFPSYDTFLAYMIEEFDPEDYSEE